MNIIQQKNILNKNNLEIVEEKNIKTFILMFLKKDIQENTQKK